MSCANRFRSADQLIDPLAAKSTIKCGGSISAPNHPYDMRDVVNGIVDEESFLEIHPDFAENIIVGFARLGGRSIGVLWREQGRVRHIAGVNPWYGAFHPWEWIQTCRGVWDQEGDEWIDLGEVMN